MKISDFIWKTINYYKIDYVSGLPGSPICDILVNKPDNIIWINVGNELDNGYIIQSYGFFSKKIGVLFVTSGPGIATALSSIANAIHENNPLVVISFYENTKYDFQTWDIKNISKNITKNTIIIDKEEECEIKIKYGFYLSKTLNTGVIILFDKNILSGSIKLLNISYNFDKKMNFDNVSEIVKKLNKKLNNTDTLLILGYVPDLDYNILKHFLDNNNIPYIITWKNRTTLSIKNFCGLIGSLGNHSANYAINKSKNLLIIGDISNKLNKNSYHDAFTPNYIENHDLVYMIVTNNTMVFNNTRNFITNDFNYIFKNLKINVPNNFLEKIKISNSQLLFQIKPKNEIEEYSSIISFIYNKNKLKIPVVTGVGNFLYSIGKYFRTSVSNNWLSSTEWASIGVGYFYGIGACLANKKPVWIIEGDGGTSFSGSTLLYLLSNNHLPLTIIIINNNEYSAIKASFYLKNGKKELTKSDEIISTPLHLNTKILPNLHEFNSPDHFYKYLNAYPTSDRLRFLVINIKKSKHIKDNNSFVYGINIHDKEYINFIKNDDFLNIKNYTQEHKLDTF